MAITLKPAVHKKLKDLLIDTHLWAESIGYMGYPTHQAPDLVSMYMWFRAEGFSLADARDAAQFYMETVDQAWRQTTTTGTAFFAACESVHDKM